MRDPDLFTQWYISLGIAAVIILAAAFLLILVWNSARRILRLARAALAIVIQIKENTDSIWHLETTNKVAANILQESEEIREHAVQVAEALHEND